MAKCTGLNGYCLICKKNRKISSKIQMMKRVLPNKRVVNILCGKCSTCDTKICTIASNEKPKKCKRKLTKDGRCPRKK